MLEVETAQTAYCRKQSRSYRKAAGQFFTPRWIASGMASWVMVCEPEHILDPAVGFGIMLDECRQQGYAGRLFGYDIDADIMAEWSSGFGKELHAEIQHQDFLLTAKKYISAAIVNPPYNRFQNRDLPDAVRAELSQIIGPETSGYTNQYALFLYIVISRLRAGGRAAFIVPSEFLATGYGKQVKTFICRNKRLSNIILFDTSDRIFSEAATTTCVLLFDGAPCNHLKVWHLSGELEAEKFHAICEEQDHLVPCTSISYEELDPQRNWQVLGQGQGDHSNDGMVALRVFGDVKRGIATGGNEFFVLRPSDARNHSLAAENLVDCIASAASAPSLIFDDVQLKSLHAKDKPCYLFNGFGAETDSAQKYVRYGQELGIDQRYLTRMRKPWYRLESRRPASLLLAVFGRGSFRVCLNRTLAVNLTAFHGFYPHAGMVQWVPLIWLYLQGSMARARYELQQRAYGDGLKKLEPGDWAKIYIPDWRKWPQEQQTFALDLANQVLSQANSSSQPDLQIACADLEKIILEMEAIGNKSTEMAQLILL